MQQGKQKTIRTAGVHTEAEEAGYQLIHVFRRRPANSQPRFFENISELPCHVTLTGLSGFVPGRMIDS